MSKHTTVRGSVKPHLNAFSSRDFEDFNLASNAGILVRAASALSATVKLHKH